jgi:hypothetical protein
MLVRLVRSHISNFSSDVRLSVRGDIVGHGLHYSAAQLPRGKIRLGLRRRSYVSGVDPKDAASLVCLCYPVWTKSPSETKFNSNNRRALQ